MPFGNSSCIWENNGPNLNRIAPISEIPNLGSSLFTKQLRFLTLQNPYFIGILDSKISKLSWSRVDFNENNLKVIILCKEVERKKV